MCITECMCVCVYMRACVCVCGGGAVVCVCVCGGGGLVLWVSMNGMTFATHTPSPADTPVMHHPDARARQI